MMATSMEADSEVLFKEKREEKGVKTDTATLRFDFMASTQWNEEEKASLLFLSLTAGPKEGAATEESVMVGNGLYLPGRIEGNGVSFLVDMGSWVSILAAQTWRKWGRAEDELTRYWGRLCSVEG